MKNNKRKHWSGRTKTEMEIIKERAIKASITKRSLRKTNLTKTRIHSLTIYIRMLQQKQKIWRSLKFKIIQIPETEKKMSRLTERMKRKRSKILSEKQNIYLKYSLLNISLAKYTLYWLFSSYFLYFALAFACGSADVECMFSKSEC